MIKDYIVEEVRNIREQQAAKFEFDIRAILNDAKERQKLSKLPVVSFSKDEQKSKSLQHPD